MPRTRARSPSSPKRLLGRIVRSLGYEVRRARPAPPPDPTGWLDQVMRIDGLVSRQQVRELFRLAKRTQAGCIVEVGSYRGRSAAALAFGSRKGARLPVYAVEPHAEFKGVFGGTFGPRDRAAFYAAMLATKRWDLVRLVNLTSPIVTRGWVEPVGLLWIDGDHSYEGVSLDFRSWEPHLRDDATVAFDDAVREDAGPHKVIQELLSEGWSIESRVGKMAVLTRTNVTGA